MSPTIPTTEETPLPAPTGSPEGYIFQRDVLGRVRVPAARREALLDEFEHSGGASGQAFAAMVGVKYSTFATWVQDRRRAARSRPRASPAALPAPSPRAAARPAPAAVRWLEAVVAAPSECPAVATLPVTLPGGGRLEISDAAQAPLAAALLRALEENHG